MGAITSIIAAIIGGLITAGTTFGVLYTQFMSDFMIDCRAAIVELDSLNRNMPLILQDRGNLPTHKLLVTDVDWKKVLIDVDKDSFTDLYTRLRNLDDLRDKIYQLDGQQRKVLIKIYWGRLNEIHKENLIESQLLIVSHIYKQHYESQQVSNTVYSISG